MAEWMETDWFSVHFACLPTDRICSQREEAVE